MTSRDAPASAKRVLVVEGDATTRDGFTSAIARAGYNVDAATDGLEAIGRLEAGKYDVVLLDLHLTRLDGLGVLAFIADRQPSVLPRVVLITGVDLPAVAPLYAIYATLPRPVSARRLVAVIEDCASRTKTKAHS